MMYYAIKVRKGSKVWHIRRVGDNTDVLCAKKGTMRGVQEARYGDQEPEANCTRCQRLYILRELAE